MAKGEQRTNKERKKPKKDKAKGGSSNVSAYAAAYGKSGSGSNNKKA
jgi:hypothetical protein